MSTSPTLLRLATILATAAGLLAVACGAAPEDDAQVGDDANVTGACTPGGLYCGGQGIAGDANKLYRCDLDGATAVETCGGGCKTNPAPKRDACKAQHTLAEAEARVRAFYAPAPANDGSKAWADASAMTPELAAAVRDRPFVPGGGADFLCAQNIPESFTFGKAVEDGEDALVPVIARFDRPAPITVRVRRSDLKIAGWTCGQPKHTAIEARTMIRTMYGKTGPGSFQASPQIEASLKRKLEDVSGVNPLLCAQAFPLALSVDPAIDAGDLAVLTVREKFDKPVRVMLAVDLDALQLTGIACEPFSKGGFWSE